MITNEKVKNELSKRYPNMSFVCEKDCIISIIDILSGINNSIKIEIKTFKNLNVKIFSKSVSKESEIAFSLKGLKTEEEKLEAIIENFNSFIESIIKEINFRCQNFLSGQKSEENLINAYFKIKNLKRSDGSNKKINTIMSIGNCLENYEVSIAVVERLKDSPWDIKKLFGKGISLHPEAKKILIGDYIDQVRESEIYWLSGISDQEIINEISKNIIVQSSQIYPLEKKDLQTIEKINFLRGLIFQDFPEYTKESLRPFPNLKEVETIYIKIKNIHVGEKLDKEFRNFKNLKIKKVSFVLENTFNNKLDKTQALLAIKNRLKILKEFNFYDAIEFDFEQETQRYPQEDIDDIRERLKMLL